MAAHHRRLVQDNLREAARLFGDKEAVVSEGRRIAYGGLLEASSRLASALQSEGLVASG